MKHEITRVFLILVLELPWLVLSQWSLCGVLLGEIDIVFDDGVLLVLWPAQMQNIPLLSKKSNLFCTESFFLFSAILISRIDILTNPWYACLEATVFPSWIVNSRYQFVSAMSPTLYLCCLLLSLHFVLDFSHVCSFQDNPMQVWEEKCSFYLIRAN